MGEKKKKKKKKKKTRLTLLKSFFSPVVSQFFSSGSSGLEVSVLALTVQHLIIIVCQM